MKSSSVLARRASSRLYAIRHKTYVRLFSGVMPYYMVNEFPKSGGTWLAQMLADALELPFRRNQSIRLERSVTHGHFLNPRGLRNVVVLWRDPRDVIVSFYYHCYFVNEHHNALLVRLMKERLPFADYANIRANLPNFIRFVSRTPLSPSFTWPAFVAVWAGRPGIVQTHYEALRADAPAELSRVVAALTGQRLSTQRAEKVAEAHSFARVKAQAEAKRPDGAEIPFVREGAIGGWQRHFTAEAEAALRKGGFGPAMAKLGYMMDRDSSHAG